MKIALIVASEITSSFDQIKAHLEEVGNEVSVIAYDQNTSQTLRKQTPHVCYLDASLGDEIIRLGELLECLGIEYVGSDSYVRAATADPRAVAHNLAVFADLTGEYVTAAIPQGMYVSSSVSAAVEEAELASLVKSHIPGGYPVWVQNAMSSTLGVVNSEDEMTEVLKAASETKTSLFVSPFSEGVALTVPVL
ncbi:MAG: hypothetical protein ACI4BI_05490, partial [Anaerotardibacter sp.]